MNIAVYGGSFNPIHIGHTSLAQSLVSQGLADEVWLLVSPLNPLKQHVTSEIAPFEHRFRMVEIAAEGLQGVRACDFENTLPVPSYMVHTLAALQEAYPEHSFSLVVGADNWQRFSQWYRSEEILERYSLLIYRRPGYDIDGDSIAGKNIRIVDTPLYDISSTQLREAVRSHRNMDGWMPKGVKEYITENGLYE